LSGYAFDAARFGDSGTIPLVRIRDVKRGFSNTYYSGGYDERFVIVDGDVLIGMDGEFNCARWQGGRALLNQRVCKISVASTKELSQDYLFHFLPLALTAIEANTSFVTVKHLSTKQISDIKIPLPPLPEQRRIADILDRAEALRAKRRSALAQLDELTRAIFLDMFGGQNYQSRSLDSVVRDDTIVTYGIVQAGEEYPEGVPYIRTGDIVGGEVRLTGLRHTDPAIAARFQRSRVEAGEIVMSIRATVGTCALVPPALHGANLTQGTARISPGKPVNNFYLLHFIRSNTAQQGSNPVFMQTVLRGSGCILPP